jgi:hypothetical protein
MLDIVVHKNVPLSEVTVSDILDSDHLPIVFHLLDHARTRNLSDLVDKFTVWAWFQSLASKLISPRIQINSGQKPMKQPTTLLPLLLWHKGYHQQTKLHSHT